MTVNEVRAALEGHLATAVSTVPVAWPGVAFTPPEGATWIRPAFRPGQSFEAEIGREGLSRRTGVFIVQVFAPKGLGSGAALALSGQIEAAFRRQDVGGVECGEPYSNDIGEDAGALVSQGGGGSIGLSTSYQVNVAVPWWAWIGE